MAQVGATLLLIALGLAAVACDTADEFAGCGDPNHPGAPGTDPSNCPRSAFADGDFRSHEVAGIVRRGADGVAGALVHVSQSDHSPGDSTPLTVDIVTDTSGFFRVPGTVNTLFDLSMTLPGGAGGRDDLLVYRGVSNRYLEPQLDVSGRTIGRSWASHVDVRFDAAIPASDAVVFLANGVGVLGVTGDSSSGIDVHTQTFTATGKLYAIEYNAAQGLVGAVAQGEADFMTTSGSTQVVMFHMTPLTDSVTPSFAVDALPAGFAVQTVDIRFSASSTSDVLAASIPWGTSVLLPIVPEHGYTYTATAMRPDGTASSTGEAFISDLKAPIHLSFPDPPVVVEPTSADLKAGDVLWATGTGVVEHVFEPQFAGGTGVRVLAARTPTTLPDGAALGVPKMTGSYMYTVRRFPNAPFVEYIAGGGDPRRGQPVATSAPRNVTLR